MSIEIINFITNYGYFAIFILIFSQEIGIPNPVPNELVLIFSGYLSEKNILSLPIIILISVVADFIGTNFLYFIFYYFGGYILKHKPRWVPISEKRIQMLSIKLSNLSLLKIYFGRITPFIRGYTSVISGLLQIHPKVFLPIALISALSWSTLCVSIGALIGPHWLELTKTLQHLKFYILILFISVGLIYLSKYLKGRFSGK